jgi:hypothetical protein
LVSTWDGAIDPLPARGLAPVSSAHGAIQVGLEDRSSMTEKEPSQIVTLRSPVQCVLWEHPERIDNKFSEMLEEAESYEDSSHLGAIVV